MNWSSTKVRRKSTRTADVLEAVRREAAEFGTEACLE